MPTAMLTGLLVAVASFFFAHQIAGTGYLGDAYYATITILLALLVGTTIGCTMAIIRALKNRP
ncbi:hypothetical protein SDD30_04560 [Moorella naiadis]|uniref:hypothetical protein n=1 Tax=Moorella naiadis (nom. illeg.) TaxID=3093670 RepID=UPI003D9C91AD